MLEVRSRKEPARPGYYDPEEMRFKETGPFQWRVIVRTPAWCPPTDVYETESAVVVRVEIAGVHEDDFTVELDGRFLSIRGTRTDIAERRAYHQMEIHFGEFSCVIELPVQVDTSGVEAVYANGFLRVLLPKSQARNIEIDEK